MCVTKQPILDNHGLRVRFPSRFKRDFDVDRIDLKELDFNLQHARCCLRLLEHQRGRRVIFVGQDGNTTDMGRNLLKQLNAFSCNVR